MLSHSWTYQALVHDVLDMKLNRVTVEVSSSTGFASPKGIGTHSLFYLRLSDRV